MSTLAYSVTMFIVTITVICFVCCYIEDKRSRFKVGFFTIGLIAIGLGALGAYVDNLDYNDRMAAQEKELAAVNAAAREREHASAEEAKEIAAHGGNPEWRSAQAAQQAEFDGLPKVDPFGRPINRTPPDGLRATPGTPVMPIVRATPIPQKTAEQVRAEIVRKYGAK